MCIRDSWRGRFTWVAKEPDVIIDGAHNPAAALELQRSIELYFKGKNLYYVFGVFRDKDYQKIIELTAPYAKHIITAVSYTHLPQTLQLQPPSLPVRRSLQLFVQCPVYGILFQEP